MTRNINLSCVIKALGRPRVNTPLQLKMQLLTIARMAYVTMHQTHMTRHRELIRVKNTFA